MSAPETGLHETSRVAFLAGARAQLLLLPGVVPFGLIYGVTALAAGFSPLLAQLTSAIVFAGSAQFVLAQMAAAGAAAPIMALTGFVVNLRHLLYSASIAPYLPRLPRRWQLLLGYLLTDEAYAVAIMHYRQEPDAPGRRWFLFGSGITLWAAWQLSTAAGIIVGARLPAAWPLDFALPLIFIALVVPALRDRPAVLAALAAAVVAVLVAGAAYGLGLIVATVAGVAVGVAAQR